MSKKIGLEAVFDIEKFEKGQAAYLRMLGQTTAATQGAAAAGGANLKLMSGPLASAASLAGGALVGGLVAATGAAVTFGTTAIHQSIGFEKQLSGVQAVLNGTEGDLKRLRDLALDLGLDTNLTVSASEAAGVMEVLAANGLTTEQILGGAARSSILLANATGTDFANAADIASTAATVFGIKAGDMESAVDGISAVTNTSRFTIEDYALALANGGAVAAGLGVEFNDFNAAIAGTASSFTSGQTSGTAFRTFITRLNPATDKAAQLMSDLGLSFYDAKGNLKGMPAIVGELNKAFSGMSEMELSEATRTIFGEDGKTMAIALSKMDPTQFIALQKAMGDVSAADQAAIRVNNTAGAIDILMGAVEGAQIALGSFGLPFLKDMALLAADAVGRITTQTVGFLTALRDSGDPLGFLVTKIQEANPALVPLFSAVKNLAGAFAESFPRIKEYVGDALGFVQSVFGTLGPQIITNVSTALNGIAEFWRQHGDLVMAIVNGAWRFITVTIGVAITWVSGLITAGLQLIGGNWTGAWETMKGTLKSVLGAVLSIVGSDLKTFITTWENNLKMAELIVKTVFGNVVMAVSEGINNAITAAKNMLGQFVDIGKAIIDGMVQGVISAAVALASAVAGAVLGAIGAGEDAGDIHSPSGETKRRLGKPLGMGAVKGVEATESALAAAMSRLVGVGVGGARMPSTLPARNVTYAPTFNNAWNYNAQYASAPKAPSQDFALMQVMAGG